MAHDMNPLDEYLQTMERDEPERYRSLLQALNEIVATLNLDLQRALE